jgi:hypothetical protein
MTALDLEDLVELFVTSVLNGTVAANGDVVNRTITGEMEI